MPGEVETAAPATVVPAAAEVAAESPQAPSSATPAPTPPTPTAAPVLAPPTPGAAPTASPTPTSSGSSGGASATSTPVPVFSITTPGSAGAILSQANIVPGDTWSYDLVLRNTGTLSLNYALTVTAEVRSGLDDPASIGEPVDRGLQLRVSQCDATFAACGGVLYDGPVLVSLYPLGAIPAGGDDHLRLTVRLPDASGNAFQGLTSVLALTWVATS